MADDGYYGDKQEPIAIIGTSCRFPGEAKSMNDLWDMLSNSRTAHGKVPADRFDADAWYHPNLDKKGTLNVRHGYFLDEDVTLWDSSFFGITSKEAAGMDPMKRLLLEVSYEAFENAGIPTDSLMNSQTGCFVGCMTNDYELLSTRDIDNFAHVAASGNSQAMIANRLSWYFGLRGPSLTLDTACSASLYALHLACQSLRSGETDMGLVTGVNLILYPNFMHRLTAMHMLSPEGISHTFDDRANGYGRGEGVGAVIVKRLRDALRDGDTIRAVIRGTGANVDGKTPSITMPSSEAQAELIERTYRAAGLSYGQTGYFETHGTGTPAGDPIELQALASTLGAERDPDRPLHIGSIKANVGHLEGCSGLAGVLKALHCLEHGTLVPTAGFETLNPALKLSEWKLTLPLTNQPWPDPGLRRASVNSFGFGGANGHVIMDDAYHYLQERGLTGNHSTSAAINHDSSSLDSPKARAGKSRARLFVLSAKDQSAVQRTAALLSNHLSKKISQQQLFFAEDYMADLAYTLSYRRTIHDFRSFAVASSIDQLQTTLVGGVPKVKRRSKHNNVVFVCTGQGAQWAGMALELIHLPVARHSFERSQSYLNALGCGWNAVEELRRTEPESRIHEPELSQPLCTVVQVAMIDLLNEWGIRPKATMGHSSGEIAAAYAADLISHQDAIAIAYYRGLCSAQVSTNLPSGCQGAMLAAGLSEDDAKTYLDLVPAGSVSVACVNSPSSVTLSGDKESISKLEGLIVAEGKFARALRVRTAYHSHHMVSVAGPYLDYLSKSMSASKSDGRGSGERDVLFFSSVTGKLAITTDLGPSYWVENMCGQVKFSSALSALLKHSTITRTGRRPTSVNWSAIVEIGPHNALQGPINQILKASSAKVASDLQYLSVVRRGEDAEKTAIQTAGQLWALGHDISFACINSEGGDQKVQHKVLSDLPSYPWDHSKGFWHESRTTRSIRFPNVGRNDFVGIPIEDQNPMEPLWRNYLRVSEIPWIEQHSITGTILYPAAGMLIMVFEAARQMSTSNHTLHGINFRDVKFERGLVVPGNDSAVETSLSIKPLNGIPDSYSFTVYSVLGDGKWTKHCFGYFSLTYTALGTDTMADEMDDSLWNNHRKTMSELRGSNSVSVDVNDLYERLEAAGMEYGELFRNVTEVNSIKGTNQAYGTVAVPDTKSSMPFEFEHAHAIHPATLDAIFHLLFVAFADGAAINEAAVPYTLEHMFLSNTMQQGAGAEFVGFAKRTRRQGRELAGDIVVSDTNWMEPKIIIRNFVMRQVTSGEDNATSIVAGDSLPSRCAGLRWTEDVQFAFSDTDSTYASSMPSLSVWLANFRDQSPLASILLIVPGGDEKSTGLAIEVLQQCRSRHKRGETSHLSDCLVAYTSDQPTELLHAACEEFDIKLISEASLRESEKQRSFQLVIWCSDRIVTPFLSELTSSAVDGTYLAFPVGTPVGTLKNGHETDVLSALRTASSQVDVHASLLGFTIARKRCDLAFPSLVYILVDRDEAIIRDQWRLVFETYGVKIKMVTMDALDEIQGQHVISLLEVDRGMVKDLTKTTFTQLKKLFLSAKHVFWLTRGGQTLNIDGPVDMAPSIGLLRVLRNEIPQISLPHLDLSFHANLTRPETARLISQVWASTLSLPSNRDDVEFAESRGRIYVPRVISDKGLDVELATYSQGSRAVVGTLSTARPMRLDAQGIFIDDESIRCSELGTEDVQIQIETVGLNAEDVQDSAVGAGKPSVGREAVGIVTQVGERVSKVKVGDRAVTLLKGEGEGCLRTFVRQHQSLVATVPANLSAEQATSLPLCYSAAWYALVEIARLSKGQSVLIQHAAGGLGQAALRIASHLGAEVFATVGSEAKRTMLVQDFGIGVDHIFDSRSAKFANGIMQKSAGRGVDVVLSTRAGPYWRESCSCVADFGFLLDLSRSVETSYMATTHLKRNNFLATIDFDAVMRSSGEKAESILCKVIEMAGLGAFGQLSTTTCFPVSELDKALDLMRGNQHSGKSIIRLSEGGNVYMMAPSPPQLRLDNRGTYILAGGLGALGIDIARNMFEAGAGHVVFLSRSGGTGRQSELEWFHQHGFDAEVFKCDITELADVTHMAQKLADEGRAIKGIVQCAMVLADGIFETMPFEQWQRATQPKIQGTWNLHAALPKELDFFVMLSSIVDIIGNAAQANYGAGNTYEDAFAFWRRSQGLSGTTINVGIVADSAHFIAENNITAYVEKYNYLAPLLTTKEEVLIAIRAAMKGQTAEGLPIPAQIILGMGAPLSRDGPLSGSWLEDRKFDHLITSHVQDGADDTEQNLRSSLKHAGSVQEASSAVEAFLKGIVASAIGSNPEDVDVEKPLYDFGVDSLKAVEVRNRLFREMEAEISVFEILSPTPLASLALGLVSRSGAVNAKIAQQATQDVDQD